MQYHKIQCNTIRYNSIPCSIIRYHVIQWNNMHFWPKNGNFRQLGPYNGLPNSRMGTYRKTEGIQSYLRIWGCYDPIESGPSETKKGGLYRCSVKKSDFGAIFWPKNGPWRPPGDNPAMRWHKKVVFYRVAREVDIIDQLSTTFKICLCKMVIEIFLDYPFQLY